MNPWNILRLLRPFRQCLKRRSSGDTLGNCLLGWDVSRSFHWLPRGEEQSAKKAIWKLVDRFGLLPAVLPHWSGIFWPFPRNTAVLLNLIKNLKQQKILKSNRGFSPNDYGIYPKVPLFINSNWCHSPFKLHLIWQASCLMKLWQVPKSGFFLRSFFFQSV